MKQHDLIVIGAGPGGYAAAIRASQLGLDVGCVDKNAALGGTCLRVGCIPSKALLESSEMFLKARESFADHGVNVSGVTLDLGAMLRRKERVVNTLTKGIDALFKKNKITRYKGSGRIDGPGRVVVVRDGESEELTAAHILIATGSRPVTLPGVELEGERIGTSAEALAYHSVPEHLAVIGAGYIGLEIGSVWRRLGARVTVLEYLDRILPGMDEEIAAQAGRVFARQGLEFRLGSKVVSARVEGDGCVVEIEGADALRCDRVLMAAGRTPYTEGLGLESVGIECDERGRIPVDDRFSTSAEEIYAVGDSIRGPMLAHKAEKEGIACVEGLVRGYGYVNYEAIPSVVYTQPEIAAVGKTESELSAASIHFRKGVFPFRASGRARCLGETDGQIKVLADARTDRVLGVHILGPRAGDLIAEAVAAIEFGATSEDITHSTHAHPTLSEVLKEAALDVAGRAIHM